METSERETKPGSILRVYDRAKAKLTELKNRGQAKADALKAAPQDDPVTAGESWEEGKKPVETTEAEENRSQEEMDETFGSGDSKDDGKKASADLPDGSATMTAEDAEAASPKRGGASADGDGKVEIESPDVRADRPLGAEDNPAAPTMSALDKEALARMGEAEDGRVPTEGLGLDDDPGVTYARDPGR